MPTDTTKLSQLLVEREVIFTADVEAIFGKRQWASRTDEILALNEHTEGNGESTSVEGSEATKSISEGEKANDTANNDNNDNNQTNG